MKCPRCESTKYRPNGATKAGTSRYRCLECNKTWSDGKIGRPRKNQIWLIEHTFFDGNIEIIEVIQGTEELANSWLNYLRENYKVQQFLSLSLWKPQKTLPPINH